MSTGLYSGASGLALGTGLYRDVSGLWGGASGLINGFGGGFSPASLFASGEPGGWYDIDPAYLYQDSAGTTPVTAPGQTVGLVLDKSQGLVLGPELVTNGAGGFSGTTGWVGGTISESGGRLTLTGAGGPDPNTRLPLSGYAANKWFEISGNIFSAGGSPTNSNYIRLINGNGSFINAVGWIGASTYTGPFRAIVSVPAGWTGMAISVQRGGNPVPVGTTLVLSDISVKELPGNHLTQSTLSNRAIYGIEPFGGRRNLLTYTEQFDNAAWTVKVGLVTGVTDAFGGTSACTVTASAPNQLVLRFGNPGNTAGLTYVNSIYIRRRTGTGAILFNTPSNAQTDITSQVSTSWSRVQLSGVAISVGYFVVTLGTSGDSIDVCFAQSELGSTATAYQRVTDQWDVTEAGKTSVGYLQFDGSDDWLVSPTITPGIDKAQVFAGVRKLSDAAFQIVAELSADASANQGSLALATSTSAGDASRRTWGTVISGSTTNIIGGAAVYAAPDTRAVTLLDDISQAAVGDETVMRLNGMAQSLTFSSGATPAGTGNFLAYPLYVGRRGGTTLPYNGRLYSLIVRFGANLDAATITQTENWVAGKTGIYTVDQLNRLNARAASGTLYSAYAAADASSNNYLVTNAVRAADGTSYNVI